jgi:hypothetical protein
MNDRNLEILTSIHDYAPNIVWLDTKGPFLPSLVSNGFFSGLPNLVGAYFGHFVLKNSTGAFLIGLTRNLTHLQIDNCNLESVEPDAFLGFSKLQYLGLGGNYFCAMDKFSYFEGLSSLKNSI